MKMSHPFGSADAKDFTKLKNTGINKNSQWSVWSIFEERLTSHTFIVQNPDKGELQGRIQVVSLRTAAPSKAKENVD